MKKFVAMLLVLAVMLSLCACGGKTSAEPTAQKQAPAVTEPQNTTKATADPALTNPPVQETAKQRPQINKFDPSTNRDYTVNTFTFSVPEYWQESESENTNLRFFGVNKTDLVCMFIFGAINSDNPMDVSIDEFKNEESQLKLAEWMLDKLKTTYSELQVNNISFLDMEAFELYTTAKSGSYEFDVYGIWAYDGLNVFFAYSLNRTDSDYEISDEFNRVLSTVEIVEIEEHSTGIRPEIKEALDSYEEFMNEYVEFMNSYMQNPTDMSLLAKYMDFLTKYENMVNKIDAMDQTDMNNEELAYYIDVTARVSKKLLAVVG